MDGVKFGPSGNSGLFYDAGNTASVEAPAFLRSVGLGAYEYSFGRGITMGEAAAQKLGAECKKYDIALSVHAPFYINFGSPDADKYEKSFGYVLSSLKRLRQADGRRVIFHTAALGKESRETVLARCRAALIDLAERARAEGFADLTLCPETMGRFSQIGTAEEIIDLCALDQIFTPCFDFGHINCYLAGKLDEDVYRRIFDYAFSKLPPQTVQNCHVHFSKIQFGLKGEVKHLDFDNTQYGPDFGTFARIIRLYRLTPTVICESATRMAEDALAMQQIFNQK